MIHYQLICRHEHPFDGWFRDSTAFERQVATGMVACPECGDVRVNRALMAPAIGRSHPVVDQAGRPAATPAVIADQSAGAMPRDEKAGAVMPDQVRAMLQRLRAEVEKNCEHVGGQFADEARAIHRGESKARGIYGESTPEQAEALAEEGIEVARVPWVPRADG